MANITVHLTLSGLIILQPIIGVSPYKWRILVPDFSKAATPHVAFVGFDQAEAGSGTGPGAFFLKEMKAHINDVKAAGSGKLAEAVIDLRETCDPVTPGCAKILTTAELMGKQQVPALELFVADATVSATAIDKSLTWFFDWSNGKTRPKKGPNEWVAEEVCLTFTTSEPTFKLHFTHGPQPKSLELKPVTGNRVEIAIRNVGLPHHNVHETVDPHFDMYYDLFKKEPAVGPELANRQRVAGKRSNEHGHRLRLIKEDGTIGEEAVRATMETRGHGTNAEVAAGLVALDFFIMSMTGSNCPPGTGDPWP